MSKQTSSLLDYPSDIRRRPTRHSRLAVASWWLLIAETLFRGGVLTIAFTRTHTYQWERFDKTVGDPDMLRAIDQDLLLLGAFAALLALCWPFRKRWVAAIALLAHLIVLIAKTGRGRHWSEYGWI